MTPTYFLGVDGGQSSTTALIGDAQGRVIGMGRGGPCNHVGAAEGRSKITRAIRSCLESACAQAGLDPDSIRFHSACLGFSGGPGDKEAILPELLATDRMVVTHDALIALSGATAGEPGIIVIAGTGSIAFGRNAEKRTARAGGWGYVFGDEGGGFDITRQALRASLRREEGWGPPTLLYQLLLDATGASDANDLLHRFYTSEFSRPDIAGFSKLVDEAAERGDTAARKILTQAAQSLAELVQAVRNQLFERAAPVRVPYIGGVFRSPIVLERCRTLLELSEQIQFGPPLYGPAAGALIEAYRAAGMSCELSEVPEMEK